MLQAVLSEAGVLKQLLVDLGGLLGPMLETEYVVMDVFLPFLLSLVEEPAMAAGGALFLAISLLKAHIASSEVRASPPGCQTNYLHGHVRRSMVDLAMQSLCKLTQEFSLQCSRCQFSCGPL